MTGFRGVVMAVAMVMASASAVRAANVCGLVDTLDFSGMRPLPFGGETIGVGPAGGQIAGASLEVTFTATGQFNAADIGIWLQLNLYSGGASFGFTGAQLGWNGQGTFSAVISSDALNGSINSFGNPYSTWFLQTANLNPGNGPITGTFKQLVYTLTYGPCPLGDTNHDASVNVADLLAVINGWGECRTPPAECAADLDADGHVNVIDLLIVINHWGEFCPNCK